MTRVLGFSPYPNIHHMAYELTLTRACQVRGAQVKHVTCDGLFSECDMHLASWHGTPRPYDICQRCQASSLQIFAGGQFAKERLGQHVSGADRREAFCWAHSLRLDAFLTAEFRSYPVAEWVVSSVATQFRQYPPVLTDSYSVSTFRNYLHSGALACMAVDHLLDTWSPDAVIVVNGRQSLTRIMVELARRRGIRVLTHDGPNRVFTRFLQANAHCISLDPFKQFWKQWRDIPLTKQQLQECRVWLSRRRYNRSPAVCSLPNIRAFAGVRRRRDNGASGRPLVAVFTTSTDEIASDPEWRGPFGEQRCWIEMTLEYAARHPEIDWIIRVHPNSRVQVHLPVGYGDVRYFESLSGCLPPNVEMIPAESPLSTYALMDAAHVGLMYTSLVGIEMAMFGKPVVLASRTFYEDVAPILAVRNVDDYFSLLDQAIKQRPSREIRRAAFRFAYRFMFHVNPEFPELTRTALKEGRFPTCHEAELAPGKYPEIDRICDFLMDGKPLFPAPPVSLAGSLAEEDRFFEELEGTDDPYRDPWLEARVSLSYCVDRLVRGMKASTRGAPRFIRTPLWKTGATIHSALARFL